MKAAIYKLFALFLSSLIVLSGCGVKKAEWKGTIRWENGLEIISNPE